MNTDGIDIVSDIANGEIDSTPVQHTPGSQDVNAQGGTANVPKDAVRVENAPQPKPDDTRQTLRDQIAAAVKGEGVGGADSQPDAPTGPARGPDGKFITPGALDAPTPLAAAPIAPPAHLTAQEAEQFAQLPAEMQQLVARTMEAANTQNAPSGHVAEIEQVIAPRMQGFALQGMTPGQVVNQLFALSDFADKDPVGFIKYFSENRGVDLEDVLFGEPEQPPVDPKYSQLEQEVGQLKQQLTVREQQEAQVRQQETANRIVSFFDAKDDTGAAIRPYANDVGGVILPYIQMVRDQNPGMPMEQILQEAYDRACWATPEVRAKMQERTKEAQQADSMRQQQERVQRKKDASTSMAPTVPSTPRSPDSGKHGGNLRDTIKAAIANQ